MHVYTCAELVQALIKVDAMYMVVQHVYTYGSVCTMWSVWKRREEERERERKRGREGERERERERGRESERERERERERESETE